ncbi:MAG: biotin transporter BioY [Micromonosporaceae bacterium]|nr:biotin transporter BioY [Micromonosporaceae bacterium]
MTDRSSSLRLTATDLARIAVFAALIAALGLAGTLYPLGGQVPITAQTLGVMLAGAILGAYGGALSVITFTVLVAAGLPLLSGGRGGLHWVIAAPTSGYLIGWSFGAFVIGWLAWRFRPWRRSAAAGMALFLLINLIGGVGVVYAIGIPVHIWRVDSGTLAVIQAIGSFLPGDLLKAVVASVVAYQVHRAIPGLAGGSNE